MQDEQGNPLPNDWNVPTQLVFYATETSETGLETVNATSDILRGIFTAQVPFPNALLVYEEIWYTLAIDTNRDGIDEGDHFEGRFRIAHVPMAVVTAVQDRFDIGRIASRGYMSSRFGSNEVHIREFRTPPSGIVFNRIVSPYMDPLTDATLCNVGLYNSSGHLVYETGPFLAQHTLSLHRFYSVPVDGALNPNETYYVAFTTTSANVDRGPEMKGLPIGHSGTQIPVSTAATLPAELDLGSVNTRAHLTIALWLVDDSKSAGKTSPRVGTSKEGIPIYAAVSGGDDAPADAPQP